MSYRMGGVSILLTRKLQAIQITTTHRRIDARAMYDRSSSSFHATTRWVQNYFEKTTTSFRLSTACPPLVKATERRRLRHPTVSSTAKSPVPRREIPSENAVGKNPFPRSCYRASQLQTPDSRYATGPREKRVSELKAKMMNIESARRRGRYAYHE